MSAYSEFPMSEFKDCNLLIEAMEKMGYSQISLDKTNYELRPMQPDLVFRKNGAYASTWNDVGFKRTPNGTYSAMFSDYATGNTQTWVQKLKGEYIECGVIRQANKMGLRPVGRTEKNCKVTLVYQRA